MSGKPAKDDLNAEDLALLREWMPKVGGVAFVFFTLMFLAAHPRPGSLDSLIYGISTGALPALGATIVIFGALFLYRRGKRR